MNNEILMSVYNKIKRRHGEQFARTIRDYHNGLLEIPDIDRILHHAGQEAEPLLPYLISLLTANDDAAPAPVPQDPFVLLEQAGYDAFHADTLEKQNRIKGHFRQGELLCTFNDAARHQKYYIVNAVKKDVDAIRREDFNGREQRQDPYGTSVISIQIAKTGGFISIKNRYNHTVRGCDHTFDSNPDNIIPGLSAALKQYFKVDFSASKSPLPEGFVPVGSQVFKYHQEINNIYYGDQAFMKDAAIHVVDKSAGDTLFDQFLFDNKNKVLVKIEPQSHDSFADDFNRCYGGNGALTVQKGNLMLGDEVLITAEESRIKALRLPRLTTMGNDCLFGARALTEFEAPALTTMGNNCLFDAPALTRFEAPALTTMGNSCLSNAHALTRFEAPALTTMGNNCLYYAPALTEFEAPALTTMGNDCLFDARALTEFEAPALGKGVHDRLKHLIRPSAVSRVGTLTKKPLFHP